MNNKPIYVKSVAEFDALSERDKMVVHVTFFRLLLYNQFLPCGAKAIREYMAKECITPLPSVSTIGRILRRQYLTHGRTGYYEQDYILEEK